MHEKSSTESPAPRTISTLADSSTRCNSDFQWIPKEQPKPPPPLPPKMEEHPVQTKPPISTARSSGRDKTPKREKSAPGSLDRRRHRHIDRHEREQKSRSGVWYSNGSKPFIEVALRSTHIPKSPPRLEDFLPPPICQGWCCSPHPDPSCFENFHRRHERIDPQRYGSSPMLMDQQQQHRGSHPDIYGDCGRFRHDGCCSYHLAPPCCFFGDGRGYHWPPPYVPKVWGE